MNQRNKIRDRIRKLAAYKSMSVTAMSEASGLSASPVNRFLKNDDAPMISTTSLNKIAVFCGWPSWDDIPSYFGDGVRVRQEQPDTSETIFSLLVDYILECKPADSAVAAMLVYKELLKMANKWKIQKPDADWIRASYPLAASKISVSNSASRPK